MVSHLLNVDSQLAEKVAQGLGLVKLPRPADPAKPPQTDLQPSPALSILGNPPGKFEGRKVGALATDGVDSALFTGLKKALDKEGATLEVIAPTIGGIRASDGSSIEAQQKIDGGPSVLYDAVAILISEEATGVLENYPAARDFVADAFAHSKFIAYVKAARPFLAKIVGSDKLDDGFIEINGARDVPKFIQQCRKIRFWERKAASIYEESPVVNGPRRVDVPTDQAPRHR